MSFNSRSEVPALCGCRLRADEHAVGALGSVLNLIVLWHTIYTEAALNQLRAEGYPVKDEYMKCLSPLLHEHINMLGRYSFSMSGGGGPTGQAKSWVSGLRLRQFGTL